MIKRVSDLLLAGAGMLLLAPLFLLAAALVLLDGPGPLLFRQCRIGRHGRPFSILKFRSMRPAAAGGGGALLSAANAPRVTRWGRLLRGTKLDELPQLFNILAGQMSVVGPRPEVPPYVALWSEADRALVLSVRPGLTEFASIAYRNEEGLLAGQADPEDYYRRRVMPRKLRLYRFYVRKAGLGLDLWLIVQTVRALIGLPSRPTPLQARPPRPAAATTTEHAGSW